MTTAAWELQKAIFATLTGDPQLAALAGVYDHVPQNVPHPYITLGDVVEVPDDAHDRQGLRCTETLHIWSRSRGTRQALEILGHVDRLLDRKPLVVPGFTKISVAREWHHMMRDPDPEIRHLPVRYRVWLEQE